MIIQTDPRTNLVSAMEQFALLPGQIDTVSTGAFQAIYGSAEAAAASRIVYVFLSTKPIPRVVGESRVIYIGQTKSSFKTRYYRYAALQASTRANQHKYGALVSLYGPIRIAVAPYERFGHSLLDAEAQLLWWYFQDHCEYPPVNYTKTRTRKDASVVVPGEDTPS